MSADPIAAIFARRKAQDAAIKATMLHEVPEVETKDRERFILERCAGKRVLNIGSAGSDARGRLHRRIRAVASELWGVDREGADFNMDLDDLATALAIDLPDVDLIVCGEVLEHLANPGSFLRWLNDDETPVIITVPNAYSVNARDWNEKRQTECVNVDHVAWYSWRTLTTLVERYGYTVAEWYWYGGQPRVAEGLELYTVVWTVDGIRVTPEGTSEEVLLADTDLNGQEDTIFTERSVTANEIRDLLGIPAADIGERIFNVAVTRDEHGMVFLWETNAYGQPFTMCYGRVDKPTNPWNPGNDRLVLS